LAVSLAGTTLTPPVFLAPMAGITDLPFRRLVRVRRGLVVSEMVASQEMVQAKPGVRERAELGLGDTAPPCSLPGARRTGWPRPRAWSREGRADHRHQHGLPGQEGGGRALGLGADARPRPRAGLIEAVVGAVSCR
jgi:tRNA-dihydrouridine synthase B